MGEGWAARADRKQVSLNASMPPFGGFQPQAASQVWEGG